MSNHKHKAAKQGYNACCQPEAGQHPGQQVKDLVCGMTVDPETARWRTTFRDTVYFFCGERCLKKFTAAPEQYLNPQPEPASDPIAKGQVYTCPMDPEVEQTGPGSCPKCGMALEPKEFAGGEEDTSELDDMRFRFRLCAALSVPVLLLVMLDHLPGRSMTEFISAGTAMWLEFALATPVMFWGAQPFFAKAWHSLVNRHPNMFTLIALGTGVAYLYSVIAALFPALFPPQMLMDSGYPDVYFEASAVIVTLVMLGQVMELKARS